MRDRTVVTCLFVAVFLAMAFDFWRFWSCTQQPGAVCVMVTR